jgi:predicted RND superfamily exporter protein
MVAQIQVDTDIANLLPESNPHVATMQRVTNLLGSEDRVEILFPASHPDWLHDAQSFAARMMQLHRQGVPLYSGFELENDTRALRDNLLYFMTDAELDQLSKRLRLEREQLSLRANPFYMELDDEQDSIHIPQEWALEIPPDLVMSRDSMWVLMRFYPAGAKSDIGFVENVFAQTDSLVNAFASEMDWDDARILYGGNLYHHIGKFRDIQATLNFAVVFGVFSILIFLMIYSIRLASRYMRGSGTSIHGSYFRMGIWSVAVVVIILLPLVVALLVTYAVGFLLFSNLNIMTTVLAAILLGVTLDYVLHFFSTYMKNRSGMRDVRALMETFFDCGKALLISCLTSGLAMLVLLFSEFRGFFEFGALFFTGIVSTYLLTITLFGILVIGLDRMVVRLDGVREARLRDDSFRADRFNADRLHTDKLHADKLHAAGENPRQGPVSLLIVRYSNPAFYTMLSLLLIALIFVPRITFEYAFNELEPRAETDTRFNEVRREFESNTRNDAAFFLFDTREQAIQAATLLTDTTRYQTIGHVESIHNRFPFTRDEQRARLQRIGDIRDIMRDPLLNQALNEITSNNTTAQPASENPDHIELLSMLQTASRQTEPLLLKDVPASLTQRFLTTEGTIGNLVIIYPNMMLADGRASIRFKEDAAVVEVDGRSWYAASTSIIGASILQIMQSEARWLMIVPLLACLLCLIAFFRSWKWGLLTFAPLLGALLLLIGGMAALGMKFNIYNIIVLPAVLGVGADNGIHLFHQLRELARWGGTSPESFAGILSSTGKFITASSITTTLGFAGLMFTGHPGLQSMGYVAVAGIMLSLLCAVLTAGFTHNRMGTR